LGEPLVIERVPEEVIIETIPDKKLLVDPGGPSLPMVGGLFLAFGLVGLGLVLLRRT
jgi:hypothetical protein